MTLPGEGGEDAMRRQAEECGQEEAERLGEFAPRHEPPFNVFGVGESPTLQAERNWNHVRWGDVMAETLRRTVIPVDLDAEIARIEQAGRDNVTPIREEPDDIVA